MSKARRPSARRAASRQLANASGSRSSSGSALARSRSASVRAISPASSSASNSGSSALILVTSGWADFTLRSFGVPKTLRRMVPKPSM